MKAGLYTLRAVATWLLVMVAGIANAEPTTRIGASYYYVEGTSALVLTAQMDKNGPADADGRHHPAHTKWSVHWRFRHNMYDGVCRMEKVSVLVGITAVRPRWRDEAQGSAALQERWNKMLEAIVRNEAYHKQQAMEAGRQIEDALNKLEPTHSCEAMTELANKTATDILETHKRTSYEYDQSTDYGRKNGVSLI